MAMLAGANITQTYSATELAVQGPASVGDHYEAAGGKIYKFVKFNNGVGNVAAVVGNMAYYYAVSGASAGQITEVTMDVTDSGGIGAGVFQSIPADGEYCWIQIAGPATLTTALTSGADGNPLTAISAGADGTLAVVGAVTSFSCAVAVDATAKIVFLTCPY
jgi:hypothetical protein